MLRPDDRPGDPMLSSDGVSFNLAIISPVSTHFWWPETRRNDAATSKKLCWERRMLVPSRDESRPQSATHGLQVTDSRTIFCRRAVSDRTRFGDVFARKSEFFALFRILAAHRDVRRDSQRSYKSRTREKQTTRFRAGLQSMTGCRLACRPVSAPIHFVARRNRSQLPLS